jgi:hypothetical protein
MSNENNEKIHPKIAPAHAEPSPESSRLAEFGQP